MQFVCLTRGFFSTVDDEDFEWLNAWAWHYADCGSTGYARRHEGAGYIMMHNAIAERHGIAPSGSVDHKNRRGLDNRKENLRPANREEQQANRSVQSNNTSGATGVKFLPRLNKWEARIKIRGKVEIIGYFAEKEVAVAARNLRAKEIFGEFKPG